VDRGEPGERRDEAPEDKETVMTDHSNVELVRRGYAAFQSGDLDTFGQLLADDVVWSVPGTSKLAGDHKGKDAIFALFALCGELSGGTMQLTGPETVDARGDDKVVSTHRVTAERGGKKLDVLETETFTIANGKIARVDEAVSDQQASDEFWS